jgi:hypothetical protein
MEASNENENTATCACGNATITVRGKPGIYGVCHCTNCRRRTGSAFGVSSYFPRENVVSKTGEMREYAFHFAERNHDQVRSFCVRCGTTLFWTISTLPEQIGIAGGCFESGALGEPSYSVTHGKKHEWIELPAHWKCEK